MIGVIDYGVGNVRAFLNVFKSMNIPCRTVTTAGDLSSIERAILPGVGSFDYAMSKLNESGFRDGLEQFVIGDRRPVLGICVGMQMLGTKSEEGQLSGLNWIPGEVKRFSQKDGGAEIRLPHMGWNKFSLGKEVELLRHLEKDSWFYYLHSYYFVCEEDANELASCNYGLQFSCAVNKGNIYGVQFHPEKSHDYGARLLRNFASL